MKRINVEGKRGTKLRIEREPILRFKFCKRCCSLLDAGKDPINSQIRPQDIKLINLGLNSFDFSPLLSVSLLIRYVLLYFGV